MANCTVTFNSSPTQGAGFVTTPAVTTPDSTTVWVQSTVHAIVAAATKTINGTSRYKFSHWTSGNGGTFDDANAYSTNYTAPAQATDTVTAVFVTQYKITVTGGNSITYNHGVTDGYFDSTVTDAKVTTDWIYNVVAGVSRTSIYNYTIEASPQNPTRAYTGTLQTVSMNMSAAKALVFETVTQYDIIVNPDAHSSSSLPTDNWVDSGQFLVVDFAPDVGYDVTSLTIDTHAITNLTSPYWFTNVLSTHEIDIVTNLILCTVTTSIGTNGVNNVGGTIDVTADYGYGTSPAITFTALTGYHIMTVLVDGYTQALTSPYTFTGITGGHVIIVTTALDAEPIMTIPDIHSYIIPMNPYKYYGATQAFLISIDDYYQIDTFTDNGTDKLSSLSDNGNGTYGYNLATIIVSHTLIVTTKLKKPDQCLLCGDPNLIEVYLGDDYHYICESCGQDNTADLIATIPSDTEPTQEFTEQEEEA